MEGSAHGERIPLSPSFPLPCSPDVTYKVTGKMPRPNNSGVTRSASMSPMSSAEINMRRPVSTQLQNIKFKQGHHNYYTYTLRKLTCGAPEVVRKIFTGTLPPTYFNDLAYGRRGTPGEFLYTGPKYHRDKELWEPKNVSREQARHVIRDIQDARFRKQEQLEKQCARKERQRFRRTELALLREADTMPRGLQSYLNKLGKLKEKYDTKVKFSRKPRKSMDNPAVYRMSLSA